MCGVRIRAPKHPSCANPTSSRTITTTFGAPAGGRIGAGHAGVDSAMVRPTVPAKECELLGGHGRSVMSVMASLEVRAHIELGLDISDGGRGVLATLTAR